jgi:protein-tyrosine phosphatase
MTRAKILLAICGLFFFLNCGNGDVDNSLSQMRLISVVGASNFRDYGGYSTVNGKMVRWRQLYRSSNLSELTNIGLETFASLGIRMVIDLRTPEEIESNPDRLPQGVDWQNVALVKTSIGDVLDYALATGDTSGLEFDKLVENYADFYISNVKQYGELLPLVMSSDNRPIDIHCAAGASRTGFTVALIQLMLGVTEVEVMDDFLLTNEVIGSDIQKAAELFRETIIDNTGQEPTEEDMENLTNFSTMHSEYLQAALDLVAEEYGSVDDFIRDGIGITDEQRNAFRAALL